MFIMQRRIVVTEGNSDKVVEHFNRPGIIKEQEGFVDLTVIVKKGRRGEEEIIVQIRWESEEKNEQDDDRIVTTN